jgi:hypothetical protein
MVKTILRWLRGLLGYPMPPEPHQIGEKLITMRENRDCHVAAIATACSVTYEQAHKACKHRNLPFFLESPIFSNPKALVAAIGRLGFEANDKATVMQLVTGLLPIGKTIILVHDFSTKFSGFIGQHWVVFMGRDDQGNFLLHWGKIQELEVVKPADMVKYITAGWPNCIVSIK